MSGHSFEAIRFLKQFGFDEDPFASTNAADEPKLASYFVQPPYFASVMGDPAKPKSHVVLAPRGGGKTAQRRMIEDASAAQPDQILCITYDTFDLPEKFQLDGATWEYHAEQIARLILIGILTRVLDDDAINNRLSKASKAQLGTYVHQLLGSITEEQFTQAVKAIKSMPERATEFIRRFTGPFNAIAGMILNSLGLPTVELKDQAVEQTRADGWRVALNRLCEIAVETGFSSVYVLVDRVDEIPQTSTDASKTFEFIKPLVTDLPTLEMDGIAFKFFLWDLIENDLRANGGRPDRVPIYKLSWSTKDLIQMISRRLSALSEGRVSSLSELFCAELKIDADFLMATLACGSPRDLIRMMARVVAEQTRLTDDATCINQRALWDGIRKFSEERSEELIHRYLPDVRRIGANNKVTFTINELASDVFRVTTQAARSKVQKWERTGLISQIGELPNPGNRPMNLYGAVDPRLAVAMLRTVPADEVLGNFVLLCPQCDELAISDKDSIVCQHCNHEFSLGDAPSLLEKCFTT